MDRNMDTMSLDTVLEKKWQRSDQDLLGAIYWKEAKILTKQNMVD